MQKESLQVLSVKEINENVPQEILSELEKRFYHARLEFGKMKKHQAQLKIKRGYDCPWGNKISEDAWVRRIRKQWTEHIPETKNIGRRGHGFEIPLKIWAYPPWFGAEQNAEEIFTTLRNNPLYAELCGLKEIGQGKDVKFDIPAARTIRYFNQVMYTFDLWGDFNRWLVLCNLEQGTFQWSDELVFDPTHLDGFASVLKTCHDCKICPKSQRCQFQQTTCEMTGIVSKSKNFKLPGVKLNLALLPDSEITIAALACRGQVHDSQLLKPLLLDLAQDYPTLKNRVKKILADAAFDDPDCHERTEQILEAQLETAINPRARKPISHPAQGIQKIAPDGVPICEAGHAMVLAGRDLQHEQFIWVCPVFNPQHGDSNLPCSSACHRRCAPEAEHGRVFRVHKDVTPQVNWENPQHLASVAKRYNKRTTVERAISRLKRILKFERFFNRGPKALQAHGDRYVITVLLVAFVAFLLDRPEVTRMYRLTALPQQPIQKRKILSKRSPRNSRHSRQSPILSMGPT
jgi:hypothetical protein